MREILFRGKTVGDNEWVYGYLFVDQRGAHYICDTNNDGDGGIDRRYFLVKPETVGQYTGLKNKNGQRIFEGDIVKVQVIENKWTSLSKYESVYEIKYHEEYCYFYLAKKRNNLLFDGNWNYAVTLQKVIGNIHDNPELLEVQG